MANTSANTTPNIPITPIRVPIPPPTLHPDIAIIIPMSTTIMYLLRFKNHKNDSESCFLFAFL